MRTFPGLSLVVLLVGCSASTSPTSPAAPQDGGALDGTAPRDATSEPVPPPVDSGVDSSVDASPDAPLDGPLDATRDACTVDANLATVVLPDTALGGDASVDTCLACARASCPSYVVTCDTECSCMSAVLGLFACRATGESLTNCSVSLLGMGNAFALGECVISFCEGACGTLNVSGQDGGD